MDIILIASIATPVSRSLGHMYGGVNTGASSSSAASAIADDTHLIYDDCPGSRALMAAAAKTQQERQLYSFHSLPHYRQTSPGPSSALVQQGARVNSGLQQNPNNLPYGHQLTEPLPGLSFRRPLIIDIRDVKDGPRVYKALETAPH